MRNQSMKPTQTTLTRELLSNVGIPVWHPKALYEQSNTSQSSDI